MEEMDNFERLIKETLEGKESPVSDRVWTNIISSLPPEQKKKPLRPLYFIIGSVVTLVSGFLYFNKYYTSEKSSSGNLAIESSSASANEFLANDDESVSRERDSEKRKDKMTNVDLRAAREGKEETISDNNHLSGNSRRNSNITDDNNVTKSTFSTTKSHSLISDEQAVIIKSDSDLNKNKKVVRDENSLSFLSSDKNYNNSNEEDQREAETSLAYSHKKSGVNNESKIQNNENRFENTERLKSSQTIASNPANKEETTNSWDNGIMEDGGNDLNDATKNESSSSTPDEIRTTTSKLTDERKETTSNNSSSQSSTIKNSINSNDIVTINSKEGIEADNPSSIEENTSNPGTILVKGNPNEVKKDSLEKDASGEDQSIHAEQNKKKSRKEFTMPKIGLEVFLTPTLSKSNLSGNVIQNDVYNDKAKIALGAGMRMNVNISEKFRTGLGLSYSSYGDRSVIKASSDKDLLYVNYNIVQDSNGAWVYIPKDTVKFKKSFSNKQVAVNSFKYISIPIFIGYKVLDGQFGLTVTGGVTANILTHAETNTYIMNSNSAIIIRTESGKGENSPFRPLVFSVFVSPGISYRVNDNLRIILDPGFTWFLSSVYKSDYAVSRRVMALECRTGIQFTLGK